MDCHRISTRALGSLFLFWMLLGLAADGRTAEGTKYAQEGIADLIELAEQRLTASQHDCIVNARDALDRGDKALAVQWVMASQMQEPLDRNWLGDHPDAVIEALRQCCG